MAASTVTAAQLTQEQVQRILIKPLETASVFLSAGPRIFDVTAARPVRIPTMVGMTAPSGILNLKSLTRFSNELARSSSVALDAALRDRMAWTSPRSSTRP